MAHHEAHQHSHFYIKIDKIPIVYIKKWGVVEKKIIWRSTPLQSFPWCYHEVGFIIPIVQMEILRLSAVGELA